MENDNVLSPLQQYSPAWGVIIGAVVLVIIAFYVVMLLLTRKIKVKDDVVEMPVLSLEQRLSELKNKYAIQVQQVGTLHAAGEISTRAAYQKLSVLLRNFTHQYSKTNDHVSTLTELERKGAPQILVQQIRTIYPEAFQKANTSENVQQTVYDTLKVISLWH